MTLIGSEVVFAPPPSLQGAAQDKGYPIYDQFNLQIQKFVQEIKINMFPIE